MGPLTFLNPALLWGALAGIVPILLHLWQRRRPRRVPFSDLRLLEEGQARRARRIALRRWLLLLLRVLAIVTVALAAARPRLGGLGGAPGGARSVVAVLDASASMQTQEGEGTRFSAAAAACAALAAALPAGSELQVVIAADAPAPLLADWQPAALPLGEALAAVSPGDGGCDLGAALREAARWSARARHAPALVVFFSDLQASAALPDSAALGAARGQLQAADGVRLLVRPVGRAAENGGVRTVAVPARALRAGEPLTVSAEVLVAHPPEAFALEVDGRRTAEAVAQGPPGGIARVEFALAAPEPGLHRAVVAKVSDRLPADDARPFVLAVRADLEVLIVHGPDRGEPAGRGGWRYLARALDPGPAAGETAPRSLFAVRAVDTGAAGSGDLASADVLCLVDPGETGRGFAAGLRARLGAGRGVLCFLGDPTQADGIAGSLLPALGLAGPLAWTVRDGPLQERARVLAPEHPVFAGLGEDALATLGEARWRRFFRLAEDDSARALVALAGGAPALIVTRAGAGAACVVPANLLPESTDLPLSPMFLPLAQRLAAYLAAGAGGGADIAVGQTPRVPLPPAAAAAGAAALRVVPPPTRDGAAPGAPAAVPAALAWREGAPWAEGGPAYRRGFYAFTAGPDTVGLVAAAVPAAEGEPALRDVAAYRAALAAACGVAAGELADLPAGGLAAALSGRDLGPWFLLFALALFAAETLVAHAPPRRRRAA